MLDRPYINQPDKGQSLLCHYFNVPCRHLFTTGLQSIKRIEPNNILFSLSPDQCPLSGQVKLERSAETKRRKRETHFCNLPHFVFGSKHLPWNTSLIQRYPRKINYTS